MNVASRIQSNRELCKVNNLASAYALINGSFEGEYRGKIAAKNKGDIGMNFIERIQEEVELA